MKPYRIDSNRLARSIANRLAAPALALLLPAALAQASPTLPDGDVGGAVFITQGVIRGEKQTRTPLPYAYFDYGPLFARVDTFGVSVSPLAYGDVEIAGRVSMEGYKAGDTGMPGIRDRHAPIPIGIGSFQDTPLGALFVYAFHDPVSSGSLLEATYVAEFKAGSWTFYPELGVERRSARYVDHLYGVSASEAANAGIPAYAPSSATNAVLGLAGEIPLHGAWGLAWQWQHKRLGASIRHSPLVSVSSQDSGFVALTWHFPSR